MLGMVGLPVKLLHLALKEHPIVGFIAGEESNDFFDFRGAVISGKADSAVLGFDDVKLTLVIVIIEVVRNIVASENIKGSGLPWMGHKSRKRYGRLFRLDLRRRHGG
jgi:hypothetical protein